MSADTLHWECAHCLERFQEPVASYLGMRSCRWHPGTVRQLEHTYTCCNQKVQRGCTLCDHVPAEVLLLSEDDGHTITVPAYILRSTKNATAAVIPTGPAAPVWRDIQGRARLEEAYWASVPADIFTAAHARAEQKCLVAAAAAKQNARTLTWQPYQPPPEEPVPMSAATSAELARTAAERRTIAALLTRPYGSELCASYLPPSPLAQSIAQELGHFPVRCVGVRLSN